MRPEDTLLSLCLRSVSQHTRERARLHLIDWLGIVLAARQAPQTRAFERYASVEPGTLIAAALDLSQDDPTTSAFLLGGLGNILEMDDLHNASIMHTGNAVIPAAIVTAQNVGASGSQILDAIVRGYEASIRIGNAAAGGGYHPFMNSTTCGVFGAAIATAALLKLSRDECADALAQAGMLASGVWQCRLEPGFAKQVASANAARSGVEAARLARAGFTGPRDILSGPLGFFAAFFPEAAASTIARPATDWKIHEVSFKPWPACRHTHPAIGAALALREQMGDRPPKPDEISRIVVRTYDAAIAFCDCPHPNTSDEARFSLQHAVAVALSKGDPTIENFGERARHDPALADLRDVTFLEGETARTVAFPEKLSAEIRVTTNSRTISAQTEHAWGDPENPMSEDALISKFKANASHAGLSRAHAQAILTACMALSEDTSLEPLAGAINAAHFTERKRKRAS